MASYEKQLAKVVRILNKTHNAYLCKGSSTNALIWDDLTEITIRLSIRDDELWLLAGSGILVRFVADSTGSFDIDGVLDVVSQVAQGRAVEYFGDRKSQGNNMFATGFAMEGSRVSAGLEESQADFSARLAGPLAKARL